MNDLILCHSKFISVARSLNRMIDTTLQRNQLSSSRFQILLLISTNSHGQIASALANRVGLSQKTLSFHLNQLENKGLIKRTVDRDDRRSYRFLITTKGQQRIERLTPLLKNIFYQHWGSCSDDDIGFLNSVLLKMEKASQQDDT